MSPTLYHVPRTISSPIVQMLLELNNPGGVAIEEMTFESIKSPEYIQQINPMGTSPSYVDPVLDVKMFESGAIIDYLMEMYDTQYKIHPRPVSSPGNAIQSLQGLRLFHKNNKAAIQKWSKYLQLKQYIIATVYPMVASMFLHSLKPKSEQDDMYMNASRTKWMEVIGPTLSTALGDSVYFLGGISNKNSNSNISVIDYLIAKPFTNLNQMGLLQHFPKLHALFERIAVRPTYQRSYSVGGTKTIAVVPSIPSPTFVKANSNVGSSTSSGETIGMKGVMKRIQKSIRTNKQDPPGEKLATDTKRRDQTDMHKQKKESVPNEGEVAEGTYLMSDDDDDE